MMKVVKSFFQKYHKLSLPVKASLWFTICNFMQRGITMITTPIFTRVLSEEQYGLISTFNSWQTILLMLTSLSLYKAIMNLYIKNDNQEQVLSAVTGLSVLLTGVWLLIYLLFSDSISTTMQMSKKLVFCLFVTFIAQSVINCWSVYERYIYDYRKLIIVTITLTALSSFLGLVCVLFVSNSAEGRIIPQTIVCAVTGVFLLVMIFKSDRTFYDKKMWLFSLKFSVGLLPHYLSEFVLQSSDKLMINYMCGTRDVAMYSVAYSVGTLINMVTAAINSSFGPYQYQKIKAGEYEVLAKRANQVLFLVGIMLVGIMLFSREIVLVFGGTRYLESVDVIVPICVGVYFNYVFQLFARAQEYYERKLTIVIPSILCAVLNLVLNYIFIGKFGYQAAAYTTFVCYAVFCVIHYFFYRKVCKEMLNGASLYDAKGILVISIGITAVSAVIMIIIHILWLKYLIIAVILGVLVIKHERVIDLIKGILNK